MLEWLKKYSNPAAKILDIGCGPGRHLNTIHTNGYHNLFGIDVNPDSISLMRDKFPDIANVYVGPAEEVAKTLESNFFDVVYTMSTLAHIHDSHQGLFDEIVRVTSDLIITVEDEAGHCWSRTPRNYHDIFNARGLKQIESRILDRKNYGFHYNRVARVFTKQR